MLHREIAREAMHTDIMHAGDAGPEQHPDEATRSSDGSPMLTKNREMPTTSAQIRNEMMVGRTR